MNGPLHGYKLRSNNTNKVLNEFGINDGQLYPALKKLEGEGLIEKEVVTQRGAPNKNRYRITGDGREEFLKWLASCDGEEHAFRYDFIRKDPFFTRVTFIQNLDKERALEKVRWQIETTEKTIQGLKKTPSKC